MGPPAWCALVEGVDLGGACLAACQGVAQPMGRPVLGLGLGAVLAGCLAAYLVRPAWGARPMPWPGPGPVS